MWERRWLWVALPEEQSRLRWRLLPGPDGPLGMTSSRFLEVHLWCRCGPGETGIWGCCSPSTSATALTWGADAAEGGYWGCWMFGILDWHWSSTLALHGLYSRGIATTGTTWRSSTRDKKLTDPSLSFARRCSRVSDDAEVMHYVRTRPRPTANINLRLWSCERSSMKLRAAYVSSEW